MTTVARQRDKPRKFRWWIYWLILAAIILFMLSPIIPVTIASSLAEQHGCKVDEGSVHPCIVDGKDIGQELHTLGMMGWLFLATAPIGLGALLIWVIAMILHRVLWGRRNGGPAAAS